INYFLSVLTLPSLSLEGEADLFDAPLSREEITEVIRDCLTSKETGPNRFTAKFYAAFAKELSPLLLEMYAKALACGCLGAHIKLPFKPLTFSLALEPLAAANFNETE
uniref:Uncharacterized protein n=1 Tax=Kryptolebias marmoratus TaxID=37003 RepID=A0A3Q3A3X8_KRYMA